MPLEKHMQILSIDFHQKVNFQKPRFSSPKPAMMLPERSQDAPKSATVTTLRQLRIIMTLRSFDNRDIMTFTTLRQLQKLRQSRVITRITYNCDIT